MRRSTIISALGFLTSQAVGTSLEVSALSPGEVDVDWTAVYYDNNNPLLLCNDASAATGGVRAFAIDGSDLLSQTAAVVPGRTKLVTMVYSPDKKGVAISIDAPTSVIKLYKLPDLSEITNDGASYKALGDWSALCSWRSEYGNWYIYLFGKTQALQFSVQFEKESKSGFKGYEPKIELVRTIDTAGEASSCAVSHMESKIFYSFDESSDIMQLPLTENLDPGAPTKFGEASDEITGLAMYHGGQHRSRQDWLLIALENKVEFQSITTSDIKKEVDITGVEEAEIQGLSVFQAAAEGYPSGFVAFAIEHDDGQGCGIASLEPLSGMGIELRKYHPMDRCARKKGNPLCDKCNGHGYCQTPSQHCDCFPGYFGETCTEVRCDNVDNCSGHGTCNGPNVCMCEDGWGGPSCSFKVVKPTVETDAYGSDGDDPAIWVHPSDTSLSKIITTTKSEEGQGLSVFDLQGNRLQTIEAGEPNNVDVLYGFPAGTRTIDLACAACRENDELCCFEVVANGTLSRIPGGTQPVTEDFSVYGSCVYRSPTSGKYYVFINSKTSEYLQYELGWSSGDELTATLVRSFMAGSGGQVEGCVVDDFNGHLFLGEEPKALWRYDAEPEAGSTPEGFQVDVVGSGTLNPDVEGVTLVYGKNNSTGYLFVSTQGQSAYNVYALAPPHKFLFTFTIAANKEAGIDAVTNTDGITAIGTGLGPDFPMGMIVFHDDANQLPDGSTSKDASFKAVPLEDILGDLMEDVDTEYNPRGNPE